jgi:hypothetical protein
MTKVRLSLFVSLLALLFVSQSVSAATFEKKLMQFGGPETRSRCIGYLKTKGIPACSVRHWKLYCQDRWIITCSQWATDFKQHEIFLIASGPNVQKALEQALHNAIDHAFAAAIAAAAATPGEVSVRIAAAIAAFKAALAIDLAAEPVLAALKDKFSLSVQDRPHW